MGEKKVLNSSFILTMIQILIIMNFIVFKWLDECAGIYMLMCASRCVCILVSVIEPM